MGADTLQGHVLIPAAAARERPAAAPTIAEVYEAHFGYTVRCLRSLGVRPDFIDDAVQDVFVVVQDKLAAFDGRAQLRTWIYAIVLRVARRYRARSAHEAATLVVCEPPCDARIERQLEQHERLALAHRALSALDDDKREIFVLAQVEQMSAPEIAEVTGLPVNTVYSRVRAARLAFSAQVARLELSGRGRSR
jgi:RNA polymerase sigma-70 factor (ECF subfamily)